LFIKGAPDFMLLHSKRIMLSDGSVVPLGPNEKAVIEKEISRMANSGLRVLAISMKEDIG
jgi:magnesium-transporting ATPase (P-type)